MSRQCIHRVSMEERCEQCEQRVTRLRRGADPESLPEPVLTPLITAESLSPGTVSEPIVVPFDPADAERPRNRPVPPRCGVHRYHARTGDEQCLLSQSHPPGCRFLSDSHNPSAGRGAAGSPPTAPSQTLMAHESPATGAVLADGGASTPMTAAEAALGAQLAELRLVMENALAAKDQKLTLRELVDALITAASAAEYGPTEVAALRLEVQRLTEELAGARREHGTTLVELEQARDYTPLEMSAIRYVAVLESELCGMAFELARARATIVPLIAKEWSGNAVVAALDFALEVEP